MRAGSPRLSVTALAVVALLAAASGPVLAAGGTIVVHDGDGFTLAASAGQQITGETDVEAGTTLTVRIESTDSTSPYLSTQTATVRADGTFAATFDLTNAAPGATVRVTVLDEGRRLARTTGRVAPCDGSCPDASSETAADADGARATELSVAHITQVTLGETVRIPVTLGTASAATVIVGGPAFNYEVAATLSDGNGDGRVDVLFHSAAAGRDARTLAPANASDSVTPVGEETALDGPLDSGEYAVSVTRGTDADADPVDDGTLVVHDSEWRPTPTGNAAESAGPGEPVGSAGGGPAGPLASAPPDAVGTIAVGLGLSLLALRLLFDSRRR